MAMSIYAYPSMRLFTPAFIVVAVFFYHSAIADMLRTPRSRTALIIMVVTACLVAAPLISLAVGDWDKVAARVRQLSVFHQSTTLTEALIQCGRNYLAHFGYTWLIARGDPSIIQSPQAYGQLNVCIIPLLLVGVMVLIRHRRQNRS